MHNKSILLPLVATLAVFGCTTTSTTQKLADGANKQLLAIKESLPSECKTKAIMAQIDSVETQIKAAPETCATEKREIEEQRDKWILAFWLLVAGVAAYFFGKIGTKL